MAGVVNTDVMMARRDGDEVRMEITRGTCNE